VAANHHESRHSYFSGSAHVAIKEYCRPFLAIIARAMRPESELCFDSRGAVGTTRSITRSKRALWSVNSATLLAEPHYLLRFPDRSCSRIVHKIFAKETPMVCSLCGPQLCSFPIRLFLGSNQVILCYQTASVSIAKIIILKIRPRA
jgi:hypothetical protein